MSVTHTDLEEAGWVRLPKDADGVPIRVGDKMDGYKETIVVDEMRLQYGSWALVSDDRRVFHCPEAFRHHKTTVKDVLADVADRAANLTGSYHEGGMNGDEYMDSMRALVAEYATKLRLVDDGDEQQ